MRQETHRCENSQPASVLRGTDRSRVVNGHIPRKRGASKGIEWGLNAILAADMLAMTSMAMLDRRLVYYPRRPTSIFLADGNAEFVTLTGLGDDRTPDMMGLRSKRMAMLVEDGKFSVLRSRKTRATPRKSVWIR